MDNFDAVRELPVKSKQDSPVNPSIEPEAARVPVRIPYNVAFREVLGFVNEALTDAGETWTDEAKQRTVSLVLDSMARWGVLCLWERK